MKVFITVYEHQYGTNVSAFSTEEGALALRESIAQDCWADHYEDPCPDEDAAEEYFERQLGNGMCAESFVIYQEEIDRDLP